MDGAGKMLLVLDLDETLIHSSQKEFADVRSDFCIGDYWVYNRPFLNEFLDFVYNNFKVGIWSSASDDYVEAIMKQILPKDYAIEFVWGRTKCSLKRDYDLDSYFYTKPLKKLKNKGYLLERILIVDDSNEKVKDNFGNAIYVKAFTGVPDDELKKLMCYLDSLKDLTNVKMIEKRDWYLKV